MAATTSTAFQVAQATALITQDTPILIKISLEGDNRKFKLPLKYLTLVAFADKVSSRQAHHSLVAISGLYPVKCNITKTSLDQRYSSDPYQPDLATGAFLR